MRIDFEALASEGLRQLLAGTWNAIWLMDEWITAMIVCLTVERETLGQRSWKCFKSTCGPRTTR